MKDKLIAETLAFFPELLRKRADYGRSREYALKQYGEDNWSRDNYTAGGVQSIKTTQRNFEKLPRMFSTIQNHRDGIISAIESESNESLRSKWNVSHIEDDRISQWIDLACDMRESAGNYNTHEVLEAILQKEEHQ